MVKNLILVFLVVIIVACSQRPSSVVFKGNNYYGKSAFEEFLANKTDVYVRSTSRKKVRNRTNFNKRHLKIVTVDLDETKNVDEIKTAEYKSDNDIKAKSEGIVVVYNVNEKEVNVNQPKIHVVKRNETLYRISLKYGVSVDSIKNANNINNSNIEIGQSLKIPFLTQAKIAKKKSSSTKSKKIASKLKSKKNIFNQDNKFLFPVDGKVISRFGLKKGGLRNDGINIAATIDSPVRAAKDGKVLYNGNELKGYGNLIIISHRENYLTSYAHLNKILVKKDAVVKKGQIIGYIGESGNVDTPQLHFSIRKAKKAVNPEKYLMKTSG